MLKFSLYNLLTISLKTSVNIILFKIVTLAGTFREFLIDHFDFEKF